MNVKVNSSLDNLCAKIKKPLEKKMLTNVIYQNFFIKNKIVNKND